MQIQEVFDRRRFVFLDGGMGTQLQQRGLQPGQKPELAALEMPDVLTAIHRDYTAAGADILLANTFGANAKKLAGCGHSVEEVVLGFHRLCPPCRAGDQRTGSAGHRPPGRTAGPRRYPRF